MKALLKRYGWIVIALVVAGGLFSVGYNFLQDLFMEKGIAAAKAVYEQQVADANAKAAAERQKAQDLAVKAGEDREKLRLSAEAEIRRINNVFAIFKSQTAAELRAKNATIGEVLEEKLKDEIVIVECKETIGYLFEFGQGALLAWKISGENIEAANASAIEALNLKYSACADWSAKLESKLKPNFWKYAKDIAIPLGAFFLGRASK